MTFRTAVYLHRGKLTPGCQLLLLRLSDSMSAVAIVSVPRSKLAEDLACPPPRITEWVAEAKAAGFLSTVRRGRPGVTAVYQGLEVRPGVPTKRYATPDQAEVRPGVPLTEPSWYATHPSQEVTTEPHAANRLRAVGSGDASSDERSAS